MIQIPIQSGIAKPLVSLLDRFRVRGLTSIRHAGLLEFGCGGVVDAVVHDAVLVELDLVHFDARHVVVLDLHLGVIKRLAALLVIVLIE